MSEIMAELCMFLTPSWEQTKISSSGKRKKESVLIDWRLNNLDLYDIIDVSEYIF